MGKLGDHAVVIGASMGGLLAARVLADAFDQVTILERDDLPAGAQARKGVPQGRHGHGLHPAGLQVLEDLFPGFSAEAAADGAPVFASTAIRGIMAGHPLCRADMGAPLLSTSRPFIEGLVRRRVAELDAVSIVDRCDVVGPVHRGGSRITGVRVLRRRDGSAEVVLDSDLVVDATGRAGQALRWLDELDFPRPVEQEVHVGVAYATQHLRLPAGALGPDRIVVVGPRPGHVRGMYLAEQEDGWWILTVFGYRGDEPGRDPDGFAAFVRAVAPPDLAAVLEEDEPLTDVVTHRLPSSLRRRYEQLRRFPEGFLVFGDAICSFNPIYGQGMTVAACRPWRSATRCATAGSTPVGSSGPPPARSVTPGTSPPARTCRSPRCPDPRPRRVRILNAYVERLLRAAEHDPAVSQAFLRTIGMLDRPPSLLRPAIAARVARAGLRRSTTDRQESTPAANADVRVGAAP